MAGKHFDVSHVDTPAEFSDGTFYVVNDDKGGSKAKTAEQLTNVERQIIEDGGKIVDGKQYTPNQFDPDKAANLVDYKMDIDTGKITVEAPSFVLEREGFKNGLQETLETISRYFQQDPDYKLPMQNGESKSARELLNELFDPNNPEGVQAYAKSAASMAQMEHGYGTYAGDRKTYGIDDGITLNDRYFQLRTMIALGDDVKDDTLQAISDLPEFDFLRKLDTYDKDTGTVQYKDLMENGWNRDKHSDEEIEAAKAALDRYFAAGNYENTDELARNIAMYEFVNGKRPDVAWLRSVAETTGSVLEGIFTYCTDFGWDMFVMIPTEIIRGVDEITDRLAAEVVARKRGESGGSEAIYNEIKDTGLTPFSDLKYPGTDRPWVDISDDAFQEFKSKRAADRALLSDTMSAGYQIAYSLTALASLISAGNQAVKGVASVVNGTKAVTAIADGTKTMVNLLPSASNAQMANILTALQNVSQGTAKLKILSTGVGVIFETFAESITQNPRMFYEVVKSRDLTDEARSELWNNFIGNTIGLGAGTVAMKGLLKAGETAAGRAASHNIARFIAKHRNFLHKIANDVRLNFTGSDEIADYAKALYDAGKIRKADAIVVDEILDVARKELANSERVKWLGRAAEDIEQDLAKAEEATIKIRMMENAIDEMRRGGQGVLTDWYTSGKYADFMTASTKLDDAYETLRKAEINVPGLKRTGRLAISQSSTNYVQSSIRATIIENMLEMSENGALKLANEKGMRAELEAIKEVLTDYEAKATPEMLHAANELINAERKWTTEANNLLMKEGLLSKADIDDMRASGVWGKNGELYSPLLREHHLDNIRQTHVDALVKNTVVDSYKYSFGKADDFLDPLAMSRVYMMKYADAKARQGVAKVYTSLTGATSNELLNVAQTRAAKIASSGLMTAAENETEKIIKETTKQLRADGIVKDLLDKKTLKSDLGKKVGQANKAEEVVADGAKKTVADYKATPQNIDNAVMSASDSDVDKIWKKGAGRNTSVGQYVIENKKTLPRNTKAYLSEKKQEYRFLTGQTIQESESKKRKLKEQFIKKQTGGNTSVETWARSKNYANSTNAARKKVLTNIYGEEEANRIWKVASENHEARKIAGNDGYKTVSDANKAAKANRKSAIEAVQKRIDDLKARRKERVEMNKLQEKSIASYKNKDTLASQLFPNITKEERAALDEYVKKTVKNGGPVDISDAGDIDKAIEVHKVKELRKRSRRKNPGFTKSDEKLLAKWEGKRLPDEKTFNKEVRSILKDYDKAYSMPEKAFEAGQEITAKGDITGEELQQAIDQVASTRKTDKMGELATSNALEDYIEDTELTPELYNEMKEFYPEMEGELKRSLISRSDNFRQMDEVQNMGKEYAYTQDIAKRSMRLETRNEELDELSKAFSVSDEQVDEVLQGHVTRILDSFAGNKSTSKAFNELAEYYGLEPELANKYYSLKSVMDGNRKHLFRAQLRRQIESELKELKEFNNPSGTASTMAKEIMDRLEDEYNDLTRLVQQQAPAMVDQKSIYAEVRKLAHEVNDARADHNSIVAIQDAAGETQFIQTDPLVASFVMHQSILPNMNALQRTNYLLSKTFRLGTTGIRLTSMVRQTFTDLGNAFVGGNVYRTWSQCVDEMKDVLGYNVVDWIKANDEYMAEAIEKYAEKTGRNADEVAYEYIQKMGAAYSPSATETAAYKQAFETSADVRKSLRRGKVKGVNKITNSGMNKFEDALDSIEDVLGKPNAARESFLRNKSFQNAFTDAVKRGYSYEDAKSFAMFAMNNATTNFNRGLRHFSNMQATVPFLGAAINGTKSFWRLFSLDPVGVMGRFVGGFVLPTMYLTSASLNDERNREAYKNLKEYQKDGNFVYVVNGQVYTIPMPQEIAALVNPFRHFVELTQGVNNHSFTELAINDILGLSPIDLDGFTNIDANMLTDGTSQDNFFIHNINPGISKLFAQLAPVPMKAAAMYLTGVDPYTMKKIDRSYKQVDPDTGETVIMGDYASAAGKKIAGMLEGTPFEMSAEMAEKILGSIFGKAPIEYSSWVLELSDAVIDTAENGYDPNKWRDVGKKAFETIADPLYEAQYRSRAQEAWKQVVSEMYTRKKQLMVSDEWQDYEKKLRNATTPEEIEKLKTVRENLLNPYYEDLKTMVNNLNSQYGAEFTKEKFAAVISLSTMETVGADASVYGQSVANDLYQDSKKTAIDTMYRLGFTSPKDYSAFGYYKVGENGERYLAYSTPLAVLETRNAIGNASNIHVTNLESLLDANGVGTSSDAYREMQKQVDEIYAKGKLKDSDYKKINQIYAQWDARVMRILFPYISEYGENAVLNSSQVTDLLDNVIKVPSDYEVNKKGRYFSAPRLNKQRGFAQSYTKYLYEKMGGK